jgi:hypothetical protein
MQANAEAILQPEGGYRGSPDAQLTKLARFWLQNAHKLTTALPNCAEPYANRLVTSVHALHACFALRPQSSQQPLLSEPPICQVKHAATEHSDSEAYDAVLDTLAQFLLPRARACCMAGLAVMPEPELQITLRNLYSCVAYLYFLVGLLGTMQGTL